jgi:hypothetical protein
MKPFKRPQSTLLKLSTKRVSKSLSSSSSAAVKAAVATSKSLTGVAIAVSNRKSRNYNLKSSAWLAIVRASRDKLG